MSFSLKLLGGLTLADERGPLTGPAVQRHRLALLALLATARPGSASRDKLMAWLWPERDTEPARRLLNQAVHALRQALGADAILSVGEDLQLDPRVVRCDVVAFEEALAAGAPDRAAALYAGPFLDGFHLDDAPEFERWVDLERDRLAAARAKALEALAGSAERAGDLGSAVEWWRARAVHDPYDSRVAFRLVQALEQMGNRAGALQHAAAHRQLLREELEIEPPAELRALVERLRLERGGAPVTAAEPKDAKAPSEPAEPSGVTARPAAAAPDRPVIQPPPVASAWSERPATRGAPRVRTAALAVVLAACAMGLVWRAARTGERRAPASPAVVDEIAKAVARELAQRERGDTGRRPPERRTRSLAAYELFLRGDDPTLIRSDSGARAGLEYFRRAVALDSTYAAAWVGVARMTSRSVGSGSPAARKQAREESEAAVRKALALDDSLAEAHALLGVLRAIALDDTAEWHFRRALALEPERSRAREWFVDYLMATGRPAQALAEAERSVELDPMSPTGTAELARALAMNGRCDEALARLEAIQAVDPPPLRVAGLRARCLARKGRWDDALAALRPQAARDSTATLALLGYMSARAGRREEAAAIQARLLQRRQSGRIDAIHLAYVPAALGDRDRAFAWLDSAVVEGSLRFAPGLLVDPTDAPFDMLEGDPRLPRYQARLGRQNR